ncbi:MAG TPA: response regulator [Thermodesulfovibrionia bacterium]|nr:response regulator [Thermodesulfovibrionia bacterium]
MTVFGMGSANLSKKGRAAERPAAYQPQKSLPARILLVEDNTINQKVLREVLKNFGCAVQIAGNGREAVELLEACAAGRSAATGFHAVLMDIQMPEMDGYEAAMLIRKNPFYKTLPIIALTASAMAEDAEKCFRAGMNDFVAKPVDPDLLLATLMKWIKLKPSVTAIPPSEPPESANTLPDNVPGIDIKDAMYRLG